MQVINSFSTRFSSSKVCHVTAAIGGQQGSSSTSFYAVSSIIATYTTSIDWIASFHGLRFLSTAMLRVAFAANRKVILCRAGGQLSVWTHLRVRFTRTSPQKSQPGNIAIAFIWICSIGATNNGEQDTLGYPLVADSSLAFWLRLRFNLTRTVLGISPGTTYVRTFADEIPLG